MQRVGNFYKRFLDLRNFTRCNQAIIILNYITVFLWKFRGTAVETWGNKD